MKIAPKNIFKMTLLLFVFSILISCSKDTDLLLDAIIEEEQLALIEEGKTETIDDENTETIDDEKTTDDEDDKNDFEIRTFTFSPTNDAYMQNGQGFNQTIVRLQENAVRTSYLMFDLSQIDGPITKAVLQFSIDGDEGDGSILFNKGVNANWTEETLSQNNAPALQTQLGSINKAYKVGAPENVVLEVSSLEAEATTIIMTQESGNDLAFASKEHPDGKGPRLIITYQAPEGSPLIEQEEEDTTQEVIATQEEDTTQEDNNQRVNTASIDGAFYVTLNGKASNDGLSEANAWSIEHAFDSAIAGDIVYIKAGDYGNKELITDNPGKSGQPIKFIGYSNTPGDLISDKGSTFNYGEQLNSNKMPLIRGANPSQGTGITINENFVEIENFQITRYRVGLLATGTNVVLRNIIGVDFGTQSNYDSYDGFGLQIKGDNSLLENCFILNATAEAVKLLGSDNSRVNYCSVYADNPSNPTDYYFLLTGGTNNTIIENSYAEREESLKHGGHGFDMKDLAEYNTFRNCTAKRTNIELNFSGVRNNTIQDCFIYGVDTTTKNWHAGLVIFNGANNNLIKNVYIQDTWRAINWADYDDGYVGPGGDRDEVSNGYDNTFDGIIVKNTHMILNVGGGTDYAAKASRNTLVNCDFSDFDFVAKTYYQTEDILFKNCKFSNGDRFVAEGTGPYAPYSRFNVSWENCSWTNVNFTPPNE